MPSPMYGAIYPFNNWGVALNYLHAISILLEEHTVECEYDLLIILG